MLFRPFAPLSWPWSSAHAASVFLLDGATVAVLCNGADEPFTRSTDQEDELLATIQEIDRGEFVSLEALLGSLGSNS